MNTIFGRPKHPFGYENIPYENAVAGRKDKQGDSPSFYLWCLTRTNADDLLRPLSQQEAVPRIVTAVAEEIVSSIGNSSPLARMAVSSSRLFIILGTPLRR